MSTLQFILKEEELWCVTPVARTWQYCTHTDTVPALNHLQSREMASDMWQAILPFQRKNLGTWGFIVFLCKSAGSLLQPGVEFHWELLGQSVSVRFVSVSYPSFCSLVFTSIVWVIIVKLPKMGLSVVPALVHFCVVSPPFVCSSTAGKTSGCAAAGSRLSLQGRHPEPPSALRSRTCSGKAHEIWVHKCRMALTLGANSTLVWCDCGQVLTPGSRLWAAQQLLSE